jgi:ABC-type branched-subunit amino acid transport system substrate-binding protein
MTINKLVVAALGTVAVLLLGGCSAIVDSSVKQCKVDADCSTLDPRFAHAICNQQQICEPGPVCTKHSDCPGQPAICRKGAVNTCVSLDDPQAQCAARAESSDLVNDETLWFGLLYPKTDGAHMEAAADLARFQISRTNNLPPMKINGPRRPLGFVSCNTDNMALEAAMNHLLKVGVPAIVGSNSSGDVIKMLTNHTVANGVLTLSPTAGAPNISDIATGGLFYRMSGSDTIAVKTLAHVLRKEIEPALGAPGPAGEPPVLAAGEQMKVAVLYKSDALGLSNVGSAASLLTFNGKTTAANGTNYRPIDYGDPGDPLNTTPAARYAAAVASIIEFRPHAIFVFGSTEFAAMDKEIEKQWPKELAYRPYWLVVKGIANVFSKSIGGDMSWARRVYGAQPYVDKSTPSYLTFAQAFRERYPTLAVSATVTATPSYFDAAYVLAYAVAANGDREVTGANLAQAIRDRLTPPAAANRKLYVGYDNIFAVYSALAEGARIDIQGLTGPLDFEPNGDVQQTQEVFCMQTRENTVVGVKAAGMIFDPIGDQVTGRIADCPGP